MPPTTSRDFQRAAAQRFTAAEALQRVRMNLDAQYLGGYTVECSLKALILHRTPSTERPARLLRMSSGASMHRPEVLLAELRGLGVGLPLAITKRMRRYNWTTSLRYESGWRDLGETRALLNTALAIYNWVEGELS